MSQSPTVQNLNSLPVNENKENNKMIVELGAR